jgi:hypothetical protein
MKHVRWPENFNRSWCSSSLRYIHRALAYAGHNCPQTQGMCPRHPPSTWEAPSSALGMWQEWRQAAHLEKRGYSYLFRTALEGRQRQRVSQEQE